MGLEIDGQPAVTFIARDITDRRRAEELESQNVYLQEELRSSEASARSSVSQASCSRCSAPSSGWPIPTPPSSCLARPVPARS